MILSVTLSKPVKNIKQILSDEYTRVKIKLITASRASLDGEKKYTAEFFTQKQVFHKKFSEAELSNFLLKHEGTTFRSCVERTETEEITILSNKKGKITRLAKPILKENPVCKRIFSLDQNRTKNYILCENTPIPFLIRLGIMSAQGKVISSKYDKFRQINRFLEFIDDILPEVLLWKNKNKNKDKTPLTIIDFGSGKSYLTFAVQYFLTEIKKIDCKIIGLDLKEDVIKNCSTLAKELGCTNLSFSTGDIALYKGSENPDIIITLHACDTATDYALDYAVKHKTTAILSVPCCQHELNLQIKSQNDSIFDPLLKYGLIKERFCALVTDAVRAQLLEKAGYKVSILEFIDMTGSPKNLLIRAVRQAKEKAKSNDSYEKILLELKSNQTLNELSKEWK